MLCSQSSWAREQLAALEAEAAEEGAAAQYSLNFLWLAKNIAVSVDQVFKAVSPESITAGLLAQASSVLCCNVARVQHYNKQLLMVAGAAQSFDRVLLLAAKRCLGGAEDVPRDQRLDL